ncbi:MAG: ATP-binding protein [Deltaproteobacteria bacterium]|jgi:serine/threonine-protein kinase RsbW|nr:ATP-binding protein [Deltaproteobacteria bacterium]MBT4089259.1 ATP-binding protein [Deltaproteobacteria bacterium]MBT4268293.1 ATP-binding protein [Deltaproteobacteria bacterium]MBT4643624.1 ATP-binding protein [Deltaproteobacteria bacterium]MBT6503580.1 ATP-binding protein [Deltaproteobacteria bacterium]
MVKTERDKDHVSLEIPSSISSIGSALKMLNHFLKQYDVSELSTTQATVVLRELMVNAITHGNKDDASSSVNIRLEHIKGKEFKIVVEDMGAGFNYAAIDTRIPDNPKTIQNRGYALIKAYTNRFEFNRKGNCIAAYFSAK